MPGTFAWSRDVFHLDPSFWTGNTADTIDFGFSEPFGDPPYTVERAIVWPFINVSSSDSGVQPLPWPWWNYVSIVAVTWLNQDTIVDPPRMSGPGVDKRIISADQLDPWYNDNFSGVSPNFYTIQFRSSKAGWETKSRRTQKSPPDAFNVRTSLWYSDVNPFGRNMLDPAASTGWEISGHVFMEVLYTHH